MKLYLVNSVKIVTLLVAFVAFGCISKSQAQIPEAVKNAFAKKYPNEKSYDWEKDAHGNIEMQFRRDGEQYRADFTKEGRWIETEVSVKEKDLPKAVRERIEKDYDDKKISELERVEHATKGVFYDVEFKQKGKNLDVEIRADGTVLNGG